MAGNRGYYRVIYSVLLDDPDFRRLAPQARHTFQVLRLCRDCAWGAIFQFSMGQLHERTGYDTDDLEAALYQLEHPKRHKPWIYLDREAGVVWIRNGLRFDSNKGRLTPDQIKGLIQHLRGLPKTPLILAFAKHYGISLPDDLMRMAEAAEEEIAIEPAAADFTLEPPPASAPAAGVRAPQNHLIPVDARARKNREDERIFSEFRQRVATEIGDEPLAAFYLDRMVEAFRDYYVNGTGQLTAHKLATLANGLALAPAAAVLAGIELYYDGYLGKKDERYLVGIVRDKRAKSPDDLLEELGRHRDRMGIRGLYADALKALGGSYVTE